MGRHEDGIRNSGTDAQIFTFHIFHLLSQLVRNDRNRARSGQPNSTTDLADTIELANGCACEFEILLYLLPSIKSVTSQVLEQVS